MAFKIGDKVTPNMTYSGWASGIANCIGIIKDVENGGRMAWVEWVRSEEGKIPEVGSSFWYSGVALKLMPNGVQRMIQCLE